VVACSGTFAKDSSHLKLAMFFDSKNITFTDVEASDGSKVPASILFPNDPKRRLEVWWSNETARKDIYLIVIGGQSTWTAPCEGVLNFARSANFGPRGGSISAATYCTARTRW
jgi:hypothetical protein